MCPYPENDHGLDWGTAETRRPFTDYGPLLAVVRGRKWVLTPHVIEVEGNAAKANLFSVPGGYAAPVVFGTSAEAVVRIRMDRSRMDLSFDALHPGMDRPRTLEGQWEGGLLSLKVPLHRGCAVVRFRRQGPNR
jgi:hypothetical protein